MTTLNRTTPPEVNEIEHIDILKAKKITLNNNIPLYSISAGSEDILKIDFVFKAGALYQDSPFVAVAANSLIPEGSETMTSAQIAAKIDFYGAFLHKDVDMDFAVFILYSLSKYLPQTLEIVQDLLFRPLFSENEFSTYKHKKKQVFLEDISKVNTLAKMKFVNVLYGDNNAYGKIATVEGLDILEHGMVRSFFNDHYHSENCQIIASGKVTEDTLILIESLFGSRKWGKPCPMKTVNPVFLSSDVKFHSVEKKDAIQSGLRIGKVMVNRCHPDYPRLKVLNTIFGGYFGSRLMSNIREDKGYTYGIGSVIYSLSHSGYFTIVSEIGVDVCTLAIREIFSEISRLRNEPVPHEELNRVKRYMMGELLRSFDGPFELSEGFREILTYGLDYHYFDQLIEAVRTVTPQQILKLANDYFQEETMYTVVAGGKI